MQALRLIRPIAPQATAGAALPVVGVAQPAPLGIYAKSTSPPLSPDEKKRELRADRYRFLGVARDLLIAEGRKAGLPHPHDYAKTAKCLHVRRDHGVSVHHSIEHKTAFYGGLVTCGSVWACPVCAAKVQERRREELARAIDWTWAEGLQPIMVTLTAPHHRRQSLKDLRQMQAKALTALRSNRGGQKMRERLGYEGMIRALEVTYGQNGWHLHTHELWLVGRNVDADEAKALILERWRAACAKAGLLDMADPAQVRAFDLHSVDVKGRCSASDYLAKMDDGKHWGADREMAKASSKAGKRSGLHPFGLLAEAAEGDRKAGTLFVEYAAAMKGMAQLYWSRGLKARVGLDEISDEELAERAEDTAVVLGQMVPEQWELVLRSKARARLLDAAEAQGWEGVLALLKTLAMPASQPLGESRSSAKPLSDEPVCPSPDTLRPCPEQQPVAPTVPTPDHHAAGVIRTPDLSIVWLAGAAWYADLESGELFDRALFEKPEPEPVPI